MQLPLLRIDGELAGPELRIDPDVHRLQPQVACDDRVALQRLRELNTQAGEGRVRDEDYVISELRLHRADRHVERSAVRRGLERLHEEAASQAAHRSARRRRTFVGRLRASKVGERCARTQLVENRVRGPSILHENLRHNPSRRADAGFELVVERLLLDRGQGRVILADRVEPSALTDQHVL